MWGGFVWQLPPGLRELPYFRGPFARIDETHIQFKYDYKEYLGETPQGQFFVDAWTLGQGDIAN